MIVTASKGLFAGLISVSILGAACAAILLVVLIILDWRGRRIW